MNWYFAHSKLFFISLMTNDELFMCLLSGCISLEKCLFTSFECLFKLGCLFIVDGESTLDLASKPIACEIHDLQTFSPIMCFFFLNFLDGVLRRRKV